MNKNKELFNNVKNKKFYKKFTYLFISYYYLYILIIKSN